MRWLCEKSLASSQALPPGRVPHVRDEFYGPQQRGWRPDGEKFPLALQAGDLFSNFDRHFEEGLKLIIAGIAAQKPAKRRSP